MQKSETGTPGDPRSHAGAAMALRHLTGRHSRLKAELAAAAPGESHFQRAHVQRLRDDVRSAELEIAAMSVSA